MEKKFLIGKKGKLLSVYWFIILFIVAGGVTYTTIGFYGSPQSVKDIEQNILANRIADCISQGGYLNDNVLTQDFRKNFLQQCNLNFATEDFGDWKTNGQYYTAVEFAKFDTSFPKGFGQELFNITEGNVNLRYAYLTQQVQQARAERNVDRIVIHFTASPTAQSAINEFASNPDEKSIHYLVDKDGYVFSVGDSVSPAFVPESQEAFHAGCIEEGKDKRPACHQPNLNNNEKANATAYPATDSNCCVRGVNPRSIGIEIVNLGNFCGKADSGGYCGTQTCKTICQDAGDGQLINGQVWEKFTPSQIDSLVLLVSDIASRYDIPLDRNHIIGHDEIDPGRKVDPGPAFPWDDFMTRLKSQPPRISSTLGRNLYVIDSNNNQYAVKILSIVGKTQKNEI